MRTDLALEKNSLGQFILLRLSNLYLNFEGCMYVNVPLKDLKDFMSVLCIVVGNFFPI